MISIVVIDLCALLMAPELKARLYLDQATKDGLELFVYAPLPRETVRGALRRKGYLEYMDGLLYEELLSELTSGELRLLSSNTVLWVRTPEEVEYARLLALLPERRRMLPRALRMKRLVEDSILEQAPNPEDTDG